MTETEQIRTGCGCSPTNGACAEHKAQNEIVASVADAVTEADEVALVQAVAYLGAVEVAPGRYAYFNNSIGAYRVFKNAGMNSYHDGVVFEPGSCVAMPSWWTPERQYMTGPGKQTFTIRERAAVYAQGATIYTVNLETGEEVSA